MTTLTAVPHCWKQVEPDDESGGSGAPHSCYSKQLKTDLVLGTFVLIVATAGVGDSMDVVARIVKAVGGSPSLSVEVKIFKRVSEVVGKREGVLLHVGVAENHLRHIPEIAQPTEFRVIAASDISN